MKNKNDKNRVKIQKKIRIDTSLELIKTCHHGMENK